MADNSFSRGQAAQPASQAGPAASLVSKQKQKQKKVASFMLAAVLVLAGAGYGVYYILSAPQRALAALELGRQKMRPSSYKEALGYFNRAIEIAPDLAAAYLNRGLAEKALEASEVAMQERAAIDFERALDLDPSLTPAHDELGQIYAARGDTSKALEHFSQSIKV
jgi:tetratricopeptide (TPR) repeat protein